MVVEKSGYLGSFAQLNMTAPCAVHISWRNGGLLKSLMLLTFTAADVTFCLRAASWINSLPVYLC